MMTPCKKRYYAVETVLYIAYYSANQPVNSRDIARQQGLPPRHLELIMQKLVHGKILRGMRGPRGGYQLARPAQRISLGEICQIVSNEDTIADISATTPLGRQVIQPLWEDLYSNVRERLSSITIGDLCEQARARNIAPQAPTALDGAK